MTPEEQYDRIIDIIKSERKRKKITLDELAKKSGVANMTIQGWIYSGRQPSLAFLLYVLDALGLRVTITRKNDEN